MKTQHGQTIEHVAPALVVVEPLTDTEAIASLLYMVEEEKMAMDVYETLYAQTGLAIFDKIASSEEKHMDALINVATKLGVDTSFISTEIGLFTNETISSLYTDLISQASSSTDAALAVGVLIEQTDIADLQSTIAETDVALLGLVYSHLLNGSEHHLSAFEYTLA
ncbi:MAG: DUF2202 domain-containing protein [Sulfurospirillaceae bacterium]|nr:DUF2202 domain-containing protein [Sulfurospirillaceae bacterium]